MKYALDLYEELNGLYAQDPEAFEQRRQEILQEYFDSIPTEEKSLAAQRLQFQIDGHLIGHNEPIDRMNKMVELFWKGFFEFKESLLVFSPPPPENEEELNSDSPKMQIVD